MVKMKNMEKKMEMVFTREGVKITQPIETPLGERIHEEKISYEELPKNGMKLVVEEIHPITEEGVLKALEFKISLFEKVSRIAGKGIENLEIELSKSSCKYGLIDVPKRFRRVFPGYKVPFILETNAGEIETYIVGASSLDREGDPDAGTFFTKGLTRWYKKNTDLRPGDKVVIEVIEPKRRYKLYKKEE